ncbi:MAG: polysaccharide deacetylase [Sphingopyxis sp. RIFCSPHIGHO2_01_FULL_65_24]|nr:MAG: polysaccharide deacetylase [Sphingopyxis sp. RIFCSPHIGHO2_01_FULL_65_24]
MMQNGLSVDVEDWFQVGAFERVIDRADWPALECRVEANCDAVLQLFAEAGVTGTFFTLGWVAERYPALIRRIVDAGHELASHGYDHQRVFAMTPDAFAADLKKTRAILEGLGGVPVRGYRAPSFSVDQRTPWAHPILAEQGYAYSSSVAPVVHDHYGWPASPRHAWRPVAGSDLVEWPVTTARFAGRTLAAGGGGFMRLLPYGFTRWAIARMNAEGHPAILYFHPWEIDPGQPRVADAPLKSKIRHYSGLSAMAGKLRKLLDDFEWTRADALLPAQQGRAVPWKQAA